MPADAEYVMAEIYVRCGEQLIEVQFAAVEVAPGDVHAGVNLVIPNAGRFGHGDRAVGDTANKVLLKSR